MDSPRTYTGWKAGLSVVFAVVVLFVLLNVVAHQLRTDRPPPSKIVTTVTPSG
ncbi:MAG TPA: hypothetical protein VNA20_04170 [Frankiaceae bacterium]|nr:hypothetical protein [Frankiaceae bacterium]